MPLNNKRIFLGFSLTAQQTQKIALIQSKLPDNVRLVPKANLHMTLAFLGRISTHHLFQLNQHVSLITKTTFQVTLNELTYWKKPKIVCLKGSANDTNLLQLANHAQLMAKKLNLHQSEYPYTPHITLCRKAKPEIETLIKHIRYQPLILSPKQLHLFESFPGKNSVEYPIIESWVL
ncbi:RNA 2',3'-cyclic phosphodiesterase [uncultured Shewanella sp.]|uniref:RNA 2',3'-cyclic phosphodiesterase n=1 Tax=uncultured Shewanella sp. TaxID=173975 RepID=UPI0026247C46|nr:RNA 2',3'-cyclic phosphodiesterase [uncultured Shewanella sp.]